MTPKVLANVKEAISGDYEMFDGFDELPSEEQERVRRAIEQGHVDDEDWKGVSVPSIFCRDKCVLIKCQSRIWRRIGQVRMAFV